MFLESVLIDPEEAPGGMREGISMLDFQTHDQSTGTVLCEWECHSTGEWHLREWSKVQEKTRGNGNGVWRISKGGTLQYNINLKWTTHPEKQSSRERAAVTLLRNLSTNSLMSSGPASRRKYCLTKLKVWTRIGTGWWGVVREEKVQDETTDHNWDRWEISLQIVYVD